MNEVITEDILDDFVRLTAYDINAFFSNYLEFNEEHYPSIVNYYSGISSVNPTVAFEKLKSLIQEQKKIIDVVILNAPSLNNYQYWIVLEYIEEIGQSLETANNASKWLRAASTSNGYKQQVLSDYMLSQGQQLDNVERTILQTEDPRDSWVRTALQNQLREEDYDLEGGTLIKVIYKNNSSIFLNGVVDNIDTAEKTYGLDIDKEIAFEDDDLVVLSYKDTILQCAEILAGLKRGDDPAFSERGVDYKNILGGSLAAISYPAIFRDLAKSFATDDSFKSFSVNDIRREGQNVMLDFTVETRAGEVFSGSSPL